MSVKYKLLADNDPGGELETAFNAMAAETAEATPEVMVTYKRISASVSLAASAELEQSVLEAQAAQAMPSWVNTALAADGIDVNDPQVNGALRSLVSESTASSIVSMGVITESKYQGLKVGHLANARQMRERGRI